MRRLSSVRSGAIALLSVSGALLVALALAQLVLPGIAASRIRSRVDRYGSVESVKVSAWPAVKLLWGSVDSVTVHARALALAPAQAARLLWEARGTASVRLSARSVRIGGLRVSDVHLTKSGSQLSGQALAAESDIRTALPSGLGVQLLGSEGGQVRVRASGALFGVGASVEAVALASDGELVARPTGLLLGALQVKLFSDPHVYVEGVGASVASARPLTYRVTMRARLR